MKIHSLYHVWLLVLVLLFLVKHLEAAVQTGCFAAKPKKIFIGVDTSRSLSSSDVASYKAFLKHLVDVFLLDTNTDNEMLIYKYSSAVYSGFLSSSMSSSVWTSGTQSQINGYHSAIDSSAFTQASSTISQQAWRQADIAFESMFTNLNVDHEEIILIVGDGKPHKVRLYTHTH